MVTAELPKRPTQEEKATFELLAQTWKRERGPSSFVRDLTQHPAYQQIVSMGPPVVSLLLEELEHNPDHWFLALRTITGQNPVLSEHRGDLDAMANDWIAWGKSKGYCW